MTLFSHPEGVTASGEVCMAKTQIGFKANFLPLYWYRLLICVKKFGQHHLWSRARYVQKWANWWTLGCKNICLALPSLCLAKQVHLLAHLCTV